MRWEIPANHDCLKHPDFAISAWYHARAGLATMYYSPGWTVTATAEIFLLIPLHGSIPYIQRLPVTSFFHQQSWDPLLWRWGTPECAGTAEMSTSVCVMVVQPDHPSGWTTNPAWEEGWDDSAFHSHKHISTPGTLQQEDNLVQKPPYINSHWYTLSISLSLLA